jgi:hypothetical protein
MEVNSIEDYIENSGNENNTSIYDNDYHLLVENFNKFKEKLGEFTNHAHEQINLFEFHIVSNQELITMLSDTQKEIIKEKIKEICFVLEYNLRNSMEVKGDEYYISNMYSILEMLTVSMNI